MTTVEGGVLSRRTGRSGRGRPALFLPLLLALLAVTNHPARAAWQVFMSSDGLLNGRVRALDVAPDGGVWFYTLGGVSRYDGLTWTSYPGKGGVTGCILADSQGNVWVNGRWKFDGLEWVEISADGQVTGANQMAEDADGNIWVATNFGVLRFDGVTWVSYLRDTGQYYDKHYCLLQDRRGALWFGTDHGLRRFRDGVWTDITSANGHDLGKVASIFEDPQGALWLGTLPIMRFDGETWTTFGTLDSPPWAGTFPSSWETGPSAFAADRERNLWMTVPGSGIVRYRDGVWKIFRDADDPTMRYLEDVAVDDHDNIWVATTLGVIRFDGEDWDYLDPGDEATANEVRAMLEERPGVVWIGTARGLYRYENGAYTVYKSGNGLLDDVVYALEWGPGGALWVGGPSGLSIFDGTTWATRPVPSTVWAILRHSSGDMYLGTDGGLIRARGSDWTVYDTEHGLPGNEIYSVAEDDSSRVWAVAYGHGVARLDDHGWRWFTMADGIPSLFLYKVARGIGRDMWVSGWSGGVGRYDGERWKSYGLADGLADENNFCILVDRQGVVWSGSSERAGVSRFDGTYWKTFGPMDGLQGAFTRALMEDSAGHIWIGSEGGVAILDQDRVAPKTFFDPLPAMVSPSRRQVLPLRAAWGETKGILYSHSVDGMPWSDWSAQNAWVVPELGDGFHEFRARARDSWGNVDPNAARAVIEIDGAAPEPMIASFTGQNAARGEVAVTGTADDSRFLSYRLMVRPNGAASWDAPLATRLIQSSSPIRNAALARWDTREYPDGDYELRLEVADTLGLVGVAISPAVVDNEPPWVTETSPATVSAASGGNVYTADGSVHLYFPPHAFSETAEVTVSALPAVEVPDTLAGGAVRLHAGYRIGWAGAELRKAASLQLSLAEATDSGGRARPGLYGQVDGADWERIGGTLDPGSRTLSVAIDRPGQYAVFADDGGEQGGDAGLSQLGTTPRVFSPTGGFADTRVSIRFSLGHPGPVTVRVYNRAGRLMKGVASSRILNAGVNVLYWDGRDLDGAVVPDGLYFVNVDAGSERRVTTVAVVR